LLVKLKPGDKKNDRNLKMGSGGYHPYGGSSRMGIRSEDRIAVKSEREANGFYRISPSNPLPSGEYGFIVLSGATAGGRMFDFGVDLRRPPARRPPPRSAGCGRREQGVPQPARPRIRPRAR